MDKPLTNHPRKRFGQKCCPEWFFCVFCGVRSAGMAAVDRSVADQNNNIPTVGDLPLADVANYGSADTTYPESKHGR